MSSRIRSSILKDSYYFNKAWNNVTLISSSKIAISYHQFSSLFTNGKCRRSFTNGSTLYLTRRYIGGSGGNASSGSNTYSSFNTFFAWYSKKLDTHPVMTKCISAGLISSLGNILAQGITYRQQLKESKEKEGSNSVDKPFQIDLAQVSRFALLNVIFVAPVLHYWYQFINQSVPGKSVSKVLQRTFWDEFVFSPCYIPIFLGMLWKLEGSSNENIWNMTKSEVPSIIVAEWITWVPTMIITFRYVPVKFQVLVINVIGVAWQTFLAYMASNAHTKKMAEDVMEVVVEEVDHHVHRGPTIIAATSTSSSLNDEQNDTATNTNNGDGEEHIYRAEDIVEEKMVPLVLNTIVRQKTPKHINIDNLKMRREEQ